MRAPLLWRDRLRSACDLLDDGIQFSSSFADCVARILKHDVHSAPLTAGSGTTTIDANTQPSAMNPDQQNQPAWVPHMDPTAGLHARPGC
jgi:hypothetical protein